MIKEIQHYQEIIKHLDLFARYFWRGYSLYPLPNSLSLMSTSLKNPFPRILSENIFNSYHQTDAADDPF